jgi:hypothetical protein
LNAEVEDGRIGDRSCGFRSVELLRMNAVRQHLGSLHHTPDGRTIGAALGSA